MGSLPGWLLTHTMVIEPFLGSSGTGPAYGRPVTVRCFVEPVWETRRAGEQRVSVGTSRVFAPLNTVITPESRVTVEGKRVEVVSVTRRDGGGLPTPDHVEITVQ